MNWKLTVAIAGCVLTFAVGCSQSDGEIGSNAGASASQASESKSTQTPRGASSQSNQGPGWAPAQGDAVEVGGPDYPINVRGVGVGERLQKGNSPAPQGQKYLIALLEFRSLLSDRPVPAPRYPPFTMSYQKGCPTGTCDKMTDYYTNIFPDPPGKYVAADPYGDPVLLDPGQRYLVMVIALIPEEASAKDVSLLSADEEALTLAVLPQIV